ncbi:hypothetical protein [Enterococcus sp. DIV0086]|uniref:hypothetical protein n=1 Tax=Enterococcus sp. DIV0086 TaxID=2774655 RepID=UPI003D2E90F4
MNDIKIWIPNKQGRVEKYELSETAGYIEVTVEQYPAVIQDYVFDGSTLHYDPEKTDLDLLKKQNAILTLQVAEADEKLAKSNKITAQTMLKINELEKKAGGSNE